MTTLNHSEREFSLSSIPTSADPKWISIQDGDVHWKVHPEYANLFFGENNFRLDEWKQSNSLEIIKTGPHRTVYRVQLENEGVYLKHYKTPDWKSKVQNFVRPSKAMLEWNIEKRMTSYGLPTIETVAIGQKIKYGQVSENYLISREIKLTETLQDFVKRLLEGDSQQISLMHRRFLASKLGHLIGKMHSGFFDHQDLHSGNVLVRIDRLLGIRLWIIDLHAIRCKNNLSKDWVFANLALFNNYFARLASRTDRRRFFHSYWKTIQSNLKNTNQVPKLLNQLDDKQKIQAIESYCDAALQKRYQKDDRKWERSHRKLVLFDSNQLKYRILSKLGEELISSLVKNPEQLLKEDIRSFWIKNQTGFKEAIITLNVDGKPKNFRLQHTITKNQGSTKDHNLNLLSNSWKNGQRISRRSVDAVQPQCWIEKSSDNKTESWLLLDYDKNMIPLSVFLDEYLPSLGIHDQKIWLQDYIRNICKNLQWLKLCSFNHSHLSGESLLVHANPEKRQLQFTQHEFLSQGNSVSYQQEIDSLTQLSQTMQRFPSIGLSLRWKFLSHYLKGKNKTVFRKYWNDIRNKINEKQSLQK
jgi:tRNA A-37 threonylcarbamoyl transferase component Bud32